MDGMRGKVSEWLMVQSWNDCACESMPRVRIPPFPFILCGFNNEDPLIHEVKKLGCPPTADVEAKLYVANKSLTIGEASTLTSGKPHFTLTGGKPLPFCGKNGAAGSPTGRSG